MKSLEVLEFSTEEAEWVARNFLMESPRSKRPSMRFISDPTFSEYWSQILTLDSDTVLVSMPGAAVEREVEDAVCEALQSGDRCNAIIFSSGTTGSPKPVPIYFPDLLSKAVVRRGSEGKHYTWGSNYSPTRMSGLQLLFQSLGRSDCLVSGLESLPIVQTIGSFSEVGVNAISLTPSQARQIVSLPEVSELSIRVLVLGGEAASQTTLNFCADAFPHARIVQVYASSELGFVYAVDDSLEGFPLSWVSNGLLRLADDDELLVFRSGQWRQTGDLFRRKEARIVFQGRKSNSFLIAGEVVWPEVIEGVMNEEAFVVNSKVKIEPHSLLGARLLATVQVADGKLATAESTKIIQEKIRKTLGRNSVPSKISFTTECLIGSIGKIGRVD